MGAAAGGGITYVADVATLARAGSVILDTRAKTYCLQESAKGARCLPGEDLLDQTGRLASFRDIVWLLGALGLTRDTPVLVSGDSDAQRDFVAGLVFLSGQRIVHIHSGSLSEALERGHLARGRARAAGLFRDPVYIGPVRDELIVLATELESALHSQSPPLLLDGRAPDEYRGERQRAARPGRLPGARNVPAATLDESPSIDRTGQTAVVAYAHDAMSSIAYFAQLSAAGLDVAVYPGGYREWAAAGRPVEADTAASETRADDSGARRIGLALLGVAIALTALGVLAGRKRRWI